MRRLRRGLSALAGGEGEDDLAPLTPFLTDLGLDRFEVKLREFCVATPGDLTAVTDAELGEMGFRPLKVRQLREGLSLFLSDEKILRLWRERCPALQRLWPADTDVSMWEGVTFNRAYVYGGRRPQVVELVLVGKLGDAAEVPAVLGELSELTVLDLQDNKLTSVPKELGMLTSLKKLDLDGNQLTSIPEEIGRLTSLSMLCLGRNRLTCFPAVALDLISLTTELNLGFNQLTSVPAAIGRLTVLTKLFLNDNQLTSVPAALGNLSSLKNLYLNGNQLTTVPAELGNLSSLTHLYLHDNQRSPNELLRGTSLIYLTS